MSDATMAMLSGMAGSAGSKAEEAEGRRRVDPRKRTAAQKAEAQAKAAAKMRALKEASRGTASDDTICAKCGKTVYAAEKREIEVGGVTDSFHETCFRCEEEDCNLQLKLSTYTSVNRRIYCRTHAALHAHEAGKAMEARSAADGTTDAREERDRRERAERASAVAARLKRDAGTGHADACQACGKAVYVSEKIDVQIKRDETWSFHKTCFRCSTCNLQLNLRNYLSMDGAIYCTPHGKEAGPQQAKSEDGYFVSPLKAKDAEAGAQESPGQQQADQVTPVADNHSDDDSQPAKRPSSSDSASTSQAAAATTTATTESAGELSLEERREARRRQREADAAREEAELAARAEERRRRRAALGADGGGDEGGGSSATRRTAGSSSSGGGGSEDPVDEFERRRAERRARLARLREES